MYIIFKGSRPAGNKKFSTYERARQHARKLARKSSLWMSHWAAKQYKDGYNPAITNFGYSIRKI